MGPPDTERRNSVTHANSTINTHTHSSQEQQNFTSDSDASTIAANADGTRSRGNTESESQHRPEEKRRNSIAQSFRSLGLTRSHAQDEGVEEEPDHITSQEEREATVLQLARKYTSQSHYSTTGQNVFQAGEGSALDPNGGNFNARAWCKALLHMQEEDEKASPPRTAGIAFRDLNVFGFGTPTDYQKSVGNVWLDAASLPNKLMGKNKTRIDILRNLEGFVESGEMLVVLGPPGSGCSTFLKTVTGETHGFFVDEKAKLNYQGTSIFLTLFKEIILTFPQVSARRRWPRTSVARPSTRLRSMCTSPT